MTHREKDDQEEAEEEEKEEKEEKKNEEREAGGGGGVSNGSVSAQRVPCFILGFGVAAAAGVCRSFATETNANSSRSSLLWIASLTGMMNFMLFGITEFIFMKEKILNCFR